MTHREELQAMLITRSLRTGEFTLASGKTSPYYINGKLTTLDSRGAYLVARIFLAMLANDMPDAVGGLTLGADPIVGAMLSLGGMEDLAVTGFIVRKAAKDHGTQRQIEGRLPESGRAVVIEDVVTTGGSALQAIEAVRQSGCRVDRVLAIVDRQEGGQELLEREGCALDAVFTASELLAAKPI